MENKKFKKLKIENYYKWQKINSLKLKINRVEIINWNYKPIILKEGRNVPENVKIQLQDNGKTLKIFLEKEEKNE